MDPKELRIGNLINVCNDTCKVSGLSVNTIDFKSDNQEGFEMQITKQLDCEPIPLTEEWLLRFGFSLMPVSEYTQDTFESNGVKLWNKSKSVFVFEHTGTIIESVHQLQNLYFALTGEELNYE